MEGVGQDELAQDGLEDLLSCCKTKQTVLSGRLISFSAVSLRSRVSDVVIGIAYYNHYYLLVIVDRSPQGAGFAPVSSSSLDESVSASSGLVQQANTVTYGLSSMMV